MEKDRPKIWTKILFGIDTKKISIFFLAASLEETRSSTRRNSTALPVRVPLSLPLSLPRPRVLDATARCLYLSLSLALSSRSSTRRNSTLASRHRILLFVLEYLLQVIPTYLGTAHQFFNIFEPALFDWGSVSQKYKSLDTRA